MKTLKLTLLTCLVGLAPFSNPAQLVIQESSTVNAPILDGNLSGLSSSLTISTPQTQIVDVNVSLTISGTGFGAVNGDFYAYLSHAGTKGILLNRVGRSATSSIGYDDNGLSNVTFDDAAPSGDVHQYRSTFAGSPLTGTWAPDARDVDPANALDTDSRSALLNSFNNANPNGEWTLFIADIQTGGTARLDSWSIEVTAVPEPEAFGLGTGLGLLSFLIWRKLCLSRPTA
jgi:subtilisin-like proprotein convertase family protein